jgi:protein-S-isoprenylcysteine O-methyltransferase
MGIVYFYLYEIDHKSRDNKSARIKQNQSVHSFKNLYRLLQIVSYPLFYASFFTDSLLVLKLYSPSPAVQIIGVVIAFIGQLIFVDAKLKLGENFSPCHDAYIPAFIVMKGIYRYIRHPLYLSNLLMLSGAFIASASLPLLLCIIIIIPYYAKSIRLEEENILAYFPLYQEYRQKTGMLLPRLWFLNNRSEQK